MPINSGILFLPIYEGINKHKQRTLLQKEKTLFILNFIEREHSKTNRIKFIKLLLWKKFQTFKSSLNIKYCDETNNDPRKPLVLLK